MTEKNLHPAKYARTLVNKQVECKLCPHTCRLQPGAIGSCRVRQNVDGKLFTLSYGHPVMMAVEPIEKKYLFHAFPGTHTWSLGTAGCTLSCAYCINWRVSQRERKELGDFVSPEDVITEALSHEVNCIAFTYTEPTIFFEYAQEIAYLAHNVGLGVVAKSNGYMTPAVAREMSSWLDAINIDLKGWRGGLHRDIVGGVLDSILENLRVFKQSGLWLEVSTSIVPGLSDTPEDLANMARFIANELGRDTPWHLQRFYPHYQMLDKAVTSQVQIRQAVKIGQRAGLFHIYTQELDKGKHLNTVCPSCQAVLIRRKKFGLTHNALVNQRCPHCGFLIRGIGLTNPKVKEYHV
jgi:pyruvate formate lyase activating enzyme